MKIQEIEDFKKYLKELDEGLTVSSIITMTYGVMMYQDFKKELEKDEVKQRVNNFLGDK